MNKNDYVIRSNQKIAAGVYEIKLEGDTSGMGAPGRFLNLKISDLYLRRPLSVCCWKEGEVTLIYKVVGQGTGLLSGMGKGELLDVLGPLGNGYDLSLTGPNPVLIGGGAGAPPLYGLAEALLSRGVRPKVVLGFGSREDVFYEAEFKKLGLDVTVATEDGSCGVKGFAAEAMEAGAYAYACGPEPMLKAVCDKAADGQFSFEARMACGFGGCMGCSCMTKYGAKRICKEGPVLRKEEILW